MTEKITMCKTELNNKALELKKALETENINISFDNNSFKDYLVKLIVKQNGIFRGILFLYYKPTKQTYSLKRQISSSQIDSIIDSTWNKLNGFEIYDSQSTIYEAFVDGAYINGITSYASIIYLGNNIQTELFGTIKDTQFRQFGGELKSVVETLKWCEKNNVKKIRINYDYQGIESFATGKWQAKNKLSLEYVNFIRNTNIQIHWRHIKSHTGNLKNNRVDMLAKKAATQLAHSV
ncbi:MAG: reverse transcriptase-like protein [Endomicrobium sp.]|jgi:ribonuclease HI|nr:reverse transcriptase-like protein [Endomicrobium sp.]